jgi:hypothetical protein
LRGSLQAWTPQSYPVSGAGKNHMFFTP